VIKTEGGEIQFKEETMSRRHKTNWLPIVLAVMLIVTIILVVPIWEETQIHVLLSVDQIDNVWVERPRTPLISRLFHPPYDVGAYTINITVIETNETFLIQNVPQGEYFVVWVAVGIPSEGMYKIEARLIKNNIVVHIFETNISF